MLKFSIVYCNVFGLSEQLATTNRYRSHYVLEVSKWFLISCWLPSIVWIILIILCPKLSSFYFAGYLLLVFQAIHLCKQYIRLDNTIEMSLVQTVQVRALLLMLNNSENKCSIWTKL